MDIEVALENIDAAVTKHYFTGRGWLGFTLIIPDDYRECLESDDKRDRMQLRRVSLKMMPKKNKGILLINLRGIVYDRRAALKIPVHVVDLVSFPRIVSDDKVVDFIAPMPTMSGIKDESNIDADVLEIAAMKNIDVTGKNQEQILELIATA